MSNAEHLLDNAIEAMREGRSVIGILENDFNSKMIADINSNGGIRAGDFMAMASHIVYTLYGGRFPDVQ